MKRKLEVSEGRFFYNGLLKEELLSTKYGIISLKENVKML
jgi:hypothetical protein